MLLGRLRDVDGVPPVVIRRALGAGARAPADNGLVPGLLREGRVTANGLRFAYLEGGSGPLVVLLHGWPDTPHMWDHQMAGLAGLAPSPVPVLSARH
jgi:hypothetical protein